MTYVPLVKDVNAVEDYTWDWLTGGVIPQGDTISTNVWTAINFSTGGAAPEVVFSGQAINGLKTSVFIAGGTLSVQYLITNKITTSGGRTDERSFLLSILKL